MICVAFFVVKLLRNPRHYLVVSLAITDMCTGISVSKSAWNWNIHKILPISYRNYPFFLPSIIYINDYLYLHLFITYDDCFILQLPPAILYTMFNEWVFDATFCNIWLFLIQTVTRASRLTLCAIAIDRYWTITRHEYEANRTSYRMMFYITIVWICAIAMSIPPLIIGNVHSIENGTMCIVAFNIAYRIYSLIQFYIPYAIMLFVYFKIFVKARRMAHVDKFRLSQLQITIDHGSNEKSTDCMSKCLRKCHFLTAKHSILGLLMITFSICWLPLYIMNLVQICTDSVKVLSNLDSAIITWLGFVNSMINPLINVMMIHELRIIISAMLCCRCSDLNALMRKDSYENKYGSPRRFSANSDRK